jgi:hypothetical protein
MQAILGKDLTYEQYQVTKSYQQINQYGSYVPNSHNEDSCEENEARVGPGPCPRILHSTGRILQEIWVAVMYDDFLHIDAQKRSLTRQVP